jgi:rhomboid protease GluP
MSIENKEDEWIDVGTYSTLDEARERALVALAMGEAIRLEHGDQPGEFDLQVDPDVAPKVTDELREYEEEIEETDSTDRQEHEAPAHPVGIVHLALWILCLVGVFHLQQKDPGFVERFASSNLDLLKQGEWWRPFTALFLHADVAHLLGNLTTGSVFYILLSRTMGALKASVLILLSGTLGNILTSMVTYPEPFVSLGASTAGFGALGLLVGTGLVENLSKSSRQAWMRTFAPVLAGLVMLGWLGGAKAGSNTDVFGHVFGFASGTFLGIFSAICDMRDVARRAERG